jgi:hypothetical protein
MSLKGIGSRIGRLEGRTKKECDGCNIAAAVQIKASLRESPFVKRVAPFAAIHIRK